MMIRFTFDTLDQLSNHLRVVDHAVLLFVRGDLGSSRGTKVMLEIQVKSGAGQTVVRSEMVARADGSIPGAWLQLDDPRLVERLRDPAALIGRRDQRRCVDQPVLLARKGGTQLAQMLDVSTGGLRIRGGQGLRQGEEVQVQLMGARRSESALGGARVVRVDRGGAGLRFVQNTPDLRSWLRGLELWWAKATLVEHQRGCCAGGALLEPAPPRVAGRANPA